MANGIDTLAHHEVVWRDDTHQYKYVNMVFSDNQVCVSLHDAKGFEKYYTEAHIHPSEHFTDTIRRLVDRIEDEYNFGDN